MNPAVNFLASAKVSKTYIPTPVQIGEQIWDQKNLDTAFYSDGTPIPNVISGWNSLTTGAWRYYNDDAANGAIYGRLYNHYAVIGTSSSGTKSLAPAGWKVATTSDWATLVSYSQTTPEMLTGVNKLRENASLGHWTTTSTNPGTNTSLFTALGGGVINSTPASTNLLTYGYWRTQDPNDIKRIAYNSNNIQAPTNFSTNIGCSVRLIKIQTPVTGLTTNPVTGQTLTSITTGGTFNLSTFPYSSITDKGIVYGTAPNPTYTSNTSIQASNPTVISNFSITISSLNSNTSYYIRSYVVSGGVRYYGTEVSGSTGTGTITLSTTDISAIGFQSAISGGDITNDGGSSVIARGVCWSSSTSSPTTANSKTTDGTGTGPFTSSMIGLTQNTHYYVRAYAENTLTTSYGTVKEFDTTDATITLTTTSVGSNFTFTTAVSGGTITDVPDTEVTQKGICWSTSTNPTTSNSKTTEGTSYTLNVPFSSTATGMYPGTPYFIKSYASNAYTTSYGNEVTVTTATPNISITTDTISALNAISVSCGATAISNPDGYTISQVGFCWGLTSDVTKGGSNFVSNGSLVTAPFTLNTGNVLSPETGYYIRAYAIIPSLSNYIVYGSPTALFTTLTATPTFTTNAAYNVTATSISSGGDITVTNGVNVTEGGICWAVSPTVPTLANSFKIEPTANGSTPHSFGASTSLLTYNTNYNIRAYLKNAYGTYYASNYITQLTNTPTIVIVGDAPTLIKAKSFTSGINSITTDPLYPIDGRGFCWGTSAYPIKGVANFYEPAGTGVFSSSSVNSGYLLNVNTNYNVRAYAYNSLTGYIAYGDNFTFITDTGICTLTTVSPVLTGLGYTTASSGGNVTSDGGDAVTIKGVCWGTTTNPTKGTSNFTSDGSGTGSFTSSITGLKDNTTYFIRSYATNSISTYYGNEYSIKTNQDPLNVRLLDVYTAYHAYSLRNLRTTAIGPCLRVRRGTTYVDVSFDTNSTISLNSVIALQSGPATSSTTLGQFAAAPGFSNPDGVAANQTIDIATWYDQSGNSKHLTNSNTSFFPLLISSGVLETIDSNVAIKFNNASFDTLFLTDSAVSFNNVSTYTVISSISGNNIHFQLNNSTNRFNINNNSVSYISSNTFSGPGLVLNTTRLTELIGGPTTTKAYFAGPSAPTIATPASVTASSVLSNIIRVGASGVGSGATLAYFNGYMQEVISFNTSTNDTDRGLIQTNINNYYTIY